jgi:saccharopine dehydrogenase (NAD+, L-lysine-forming)
VIHVERSKARIFNDDEFEAAGATLVPEGSWVNAPTDYIIIGLKELPDAACTSFFLAAEFVIPAYHQRFTTLVPLQHAHVQFGHCYKQQENWDRYLSRFRRGGGVLYDIEFLTDARGQRVSAFGYHAGYAGAAIALLAWSHQLRHPTPLPSVTSYASDAALVGAVKEAVASAIPRNDNQHPRVLVMGALGRCGSGAVDLCLAAGIPSSHVLKWDVAETAAGGPFREIATADIFINCIYLSKPIPPLVTLDSLAEPGRKLRVACDVSCDPNNPHNPVPIYRECSTFIQPTLPVEVAGDGPPLTMVSIDHLPSLLPREASEAFSRKLLPTLKTLDRRHEDDVWQRAEKLFRAKLQELPAES